MQTKTKILTAAAIAIFALGFNITNAEAQQATMAASNITCNSAVLESNITISPYGPKTDVWFQWGPNLFLSNTTPAQVIASSGAFSQQITGLAANTTYFYRGAANNSVFGTVFGSVRSFTTPACNVPGTVTVTTNSATSIGQNAATLNGFVDPRGNADVSIAFNWGTTAAFGNTTPSFNAGSASGNFNFTLTGLAPDTTYFFRAIAQVSGGAIVNGATMSFITSSGAGTNLEPVVVTKTVTELSSSTVVLNGFVDPQGVSNTRAWFEWGTNQSSPLGSVTQWQNYGGSPMSFSATISGLLPNTTYYYRAVAANQNGTSFGQIYVLQPQTGGGSYGGGSSYGGSSYGSSSYGGSSYNQNSLYAYSQKTTFPFFTIAGNGGQFSGFSAANPYPGTYPTYSSACTYNCGATNYNAYGNQPIVNTYSPNVSCNFAVLNGYVDPNGNSYVVRWFEWGGNAYSLSNNTVKTNQSYAGTFSDNIINLSPNATYYYRAAAQSSSGTTYGQTLSFNTSQGGGGYGGYGASSCQAPSYGAAQVLVVTNLPSNVTQSSARFNGQVILQGTNTPSNGWFEWGTSISLGNTTQTRNVGSDYTNIFSESQGGLSPNTTYYYRAVGQNQYGIFKGDIVSFTTPGISAQVYVPAPKTYVTKAISTAVSRVYTSQTSLIDLIITSDFEGVCRGDRVSFSVNYANTSNETVGYVAIRVVIPSEYTYVDSSRGSYDEKSRTLTVDVGTLAPGQSGIIVVKAKADSLAVSNATMVTTAKAVYTRTSGAQEETIGYIIQKEECRASLSALALFGAGGFFPSTLLGWLILIIIILILILISRNLYGTYKESKEAK